mmetsp:Transcript_20072/g.30055  ORF Transcript_20072/g.30055 Transcript_20072/m.30055 type:complete len:1056 (-) Transcript_20072:132-3299(-)
MTGAVKRSQVPAKSHHEKITAKPIRKKVEYDPAPAPDAVIYAAYFLLIGAVGYALSYDSDTMKAFVDSGFSFQSLKDSISNFRYKHNETNCSSFSFLVTVHIVYVILLQIVTKYASTKTTIPGWLPAARKAHNCFLAVLSAFMLGALVVGAYFDGRFNSFYCFACRRTEDYQPGLVVWAMYIFYLSKMLEFIDTFFLVLAKKKVILLHKVHHLTTMSLVWHALEVNLPSEIVCGGLNCFVHTLMYAYYAFPEGNRWLRAYMTSTQILQFVFCLVALVYAAAVRAMGTPCQGSSSAEWHGIVMYGVYLAMFVAFFISNYCRKKSKKSRSSVTTSEQTNNTPHISTKSGPAPSTGTKLAIWSTYFLILSVAVAWLMQDSATMKVLKESENFSVSKFAQAIEYDVEGFRWVSGVTRAGSWQFLLGVHIVYAGTLQVITYLMEDVKERVWWAKPLSKAHNVLMASLSFVMLAGLVYGGIRDGRFNSWDCLVCQKPKASGIIQLSMYTFYLSKMLEFIDTFLLILSKKKVILLHKVHHLTTMSLVWHSLETDLPSEILCGGLNCFVHTLMYAYYAFPDGNRWLRKYMTSTQILQFVFCLVGLIYAQISRVAGKPCMGTGAAEWHGIIMYGVYLGMFALFFYHNYMKKKKSKKTKETAEGDSKKELHEVILFGKRVNVSGFLKKHPGGSKVLRIFRDRDATEQFEAYHSDRAYRWLKALPKRDVLERDNLVSETKLAKEFKKLINTFKEKGFYKMDILDEIIKLFVVFGCYIGGHYLLFNERPLTGCLIMGFGLYYSGWVSHDYLHHAVLKGGKNADETTGALVPFNNAMGYIIGFMQGYEVDWWRARHNTHHVVTNEHGNDPDIKTSPLLTYVRDSPEIAKGLNFIQRWQQYYYLPVMAILDLYWRLESIAYIAVRLPRYWKQALVMVAHVIWTAYAFHGNYQYFWIMCIFRGFLTGTVVFSTHYGEDILDKDHNMTLVEQTAKTSRNISGGYIADFLTGFISLQTEHHLFPMMPTANLAKARPYVMDFFKKHGLEYRESNFIECIRYNIRALRFDHVLE